MIGWVVGVAADELVFGVFDVIRGLPGNCFGMLELFIWVYKGWCGLVPVVVR